MYRQLSYSDGGAENSPPSKGRRKSPSLPPKGLWLSLTEHPAVSLTHPFILGGLLKAMPSEIGIVLQQG